jgi:hypothetical protein
VLQLIKEGIITVEQLLNKGIIEEVVVDGDVKGTEGVETLETQQLIGGQIFTADDGQQLGEEEAASFA